VVARAPCGCPRLLGAGAARRSSAHLACGADFDVLAERLTAVRTAPLTATTARAAQEAMRTLAHRSAGAQRMPIVDYLIGAAAQETGAAVLHYDSDYDTLAEIMGFEPVWLAPPGSLP